MYIPPPIENINLRGHPELSTFSTYEITSNKREADGRKNVGNLIVLFDAIFLSCEKNVDCLVRRGSKSYEMLFHK